MNSELRVGLLGHKVAYSKSNEIFDAIFSREKIKGSFDTFDFPSEDLPQQLAGILKSGIKGFSVTIPHKKSVIEHMKELSPVARTIQAVNSVAVRNGEAYGFNTDCDGFALPLRRHSELLKNSSALILGTGGAARAAIYSLSTDYEVKTFTVIGRTISRLQELKGMLREELSNAKIQLETLETLGYGDTDWSIMVNATPLGGWNHPNESPLPRSFPWKAVGIYYDLNYNDGNRLCRLASEAGLFSIDGSKMLVAQAIASFEIWTEIKVDFEPIYEVVFGQLVEGKQ